KTSLPARQLTRRVDWRKNWPRRSNLAFACRFCMHSLDVVKSGSTPSSLEQMDCTGENTMRFLSIYRSPERNTPPSQEEMESMGKLIEAGMRKGWLLGTEGCLPSALGARVRISDGNFSVTDVPSPSPRSWLEDSQFCRQTRRKKRSS